jgi:hypothetical protein
MSDDLIKRLRESRATWSNEGGKVHACPTDLEAEAAAALAEARAEVERLREALTTIADGPPFSEVPSVWIARCVHKARAALSPKTPDTGK